MWLSVEARSRTKTSMFVWITRKTEIFSKLKACHCWANRVPFECEHFRYDNSNNFPGIYSCIFALHFRESVPSWNFQLNRGFLYFFPHSKLRIRCCWLSAVIHWSSPFVDFGSECRHNKREQSHFRRSWWAAHRNSIKSALAISRVSFTNRQRSAIWVLSRIGVVSEYSVSSLRCN